MNLTLDVSAASERANAIPTPELDSATLAFSACTPSGDS
jgi:hypothetical protein